jgi:hypothetical protein
MPPLQQSRSMHEPSYERCRPDDGRCIISASVPRSGKIQDARMIRKEVWLRTTGENWSGCGGCLSVSQIARILNRVASQKEVPPLQGCHFGACLAIDTGRASSSETITAPARQRVPQKWSDVQGRKGEVRSLRFLGASRNLISATSLLVHRLALEPFLQNVVVHGVTQSIGKPHRRTRQCAVHLLLKHLARRRNHQWRDTATSSSRPGAEAMPTSLSGAHTLVAWPIARW